MSVAIITGGTSGLGLAIAGRLAAAGKSVVTVSRREAGDPRFTHVTGDASRAETVHHAIAVAIELGTIDLLVNCAGVGIFGHAGSYDEEEVRQVIDANLISTILFCDALFPSFSRDGGTIVNVLSTAALVAKPKESVYCAAKWGARGYTEVLRAEAKGTMARVISVAPGGMQTGFWSERREGFMDPEEIAAIVFDALNRPVNVSSIVIERT
jgi:NAD(P)-dependent dehydrogenase (short-subunit alcohol dehydrogenase family)